GARGRHARPLRDRREERPLPAAALGRAAAARRRGTRGDPQAFAHPRRRADRESPLEPGEGDHGAVHGAEPRGDDDRAGDALGDECGIRQTGDSIEGWMGGEVMDTLLQDFRYAVRTLAKSPGFTAVVVLTLALGIGANTAIFSVVNGVLLTPLPYRDPSRLVVVWESKGTSNHNVVNPANYMDWHDRATSFSGFALLSWTGLAFTGDQVEEVQGRAVTPDFFGVVGVTPERAQTEMSRIARQLESDHPDFDTGWGATVVPLMEQVVGGSRRTILIVLGAVSLVLLIACANVANLMLVRTASRERELAARAALGAPRRRR